MTTEQLCRNLLIRMREIDERISTSLYRDLATGEQDECPTGDDFNLLWDACMDEIRAAGCTLRPVDMSR